MRVLLFLIVCLVCIPSYAANIKIGFIDTNIVVTSLTQYKESIDSISREFEPKKQELLDLFNHIELLRANIETVSYTHLKLPTSDLV